MYVTCVSYEADLWENDVNHKCKERSNSGGNAEIVQALYKLAQ